MHLACGVFRAVETRKPLVIAANGGISAWIDHYGRIRAQSPRQTAGCNSGRRRTKRDDELYYRDFGDWFAAACLACCVALAIIGWRSQPFAKVTARRRSILNPEP